MSAAPETGSAVAERLALGALEYPIPARANRLDFILGALTLVALALLAATGIVLTQFYNPAPLAQVAVDAGGVFSDSVRVPAEARPGPYRLVARAADGDVVAGLDVEVVSAPPSSTDHATHSAQMPMPSAEPMRLDRVRSRTLTGVTLVAIFSLLGLGVLLLRRPAEPHTDGS